MGLHFQWGSVRAYALLLPLRLVCRRGRLPLGLAALGGGELALGLALGPLKALLAIRGPVLDECGVDGVVGGPGARERLARLKEPMLQRVPVANARLEQPARKAPVVVGEELAVERELLEAFVVGPRGVGNKRGHKGKQGEHRGAGVGVLAMSGFYGRFGAISGRGR